MKKLILSLFMVAICGLAHASNAVETPKVEKGALMVSLTIEDTQISEEDVECSVASLPVCSGGEAAYYITMTICATDLPAFIDSMQC